jgi:protein involved in polysaccharide export with SLBB domain
MPPATILLTSPSTVNGTRAACAWRLLASLLILAGLALLPNSAAAQTNPPVETRSATTALPESELAHIGPADVLVVTVYQEDDLNTRVTVDGKGMVSLPLLGSVKVGGFTTDQAAAAIRDLYGKDYLVNPQVTVAIAERAKRRFTVLGQVTKPGVYEFPPNESVNLLQAIAMAGGYTRLASASKVTLQRQDPGGSRTLKFDAQAMARDTQTPPFAVLPDDVITIGERLF